MSSNNVKQQVAAMEGSEASGGEGDGGNEDSNNASTYLWKNTRVVGG
jgi:hypothetical protein